MAFAGPTDVDTAYEGNLPAGSERRVQYLLDTVSARLRILLPNLEERIEDDDDLRLLAKDVVAQAVIRRLPGVTQSVESQTQSAGPWSTTVRYTADVSGTFSDEDLTMLGGTPVGTVTASTGTVGTIKLGFPDWSNP